MRQQLIRTIGLLAAVVVAALAGAAAPSAAAPPATTSPVQQDQVNIVGQLLDNRTTPKTPVSGVKISVFDDQDNLVGEDRSGKDGRFKIPLGDAITVLGQDFIVKLDDSTLPENSYLTDPKDIERTVSIRIASDVAVNFTIGPNIFAEDPWYDQGLDLLVSGILLGLLLALCSLGLSLVFGTTGLTNFAHGELVTFGAIVAYSFTTSWGGFNLVPAAILAVLVSGLFGFGQDRWFWGQLRKRGTGVIAMMIVSIGLALVLRNVYQIWFGSRTRQYQDYNALEGVDFGPFTANYKTLAGMAVCIVVILAIAFALLLTRLGKATRAVADNPSLAAASGIDVERVIRVVWTVGAAAAGLAGIVLGMSQGVRFTMGTQILLLVFAGVTLGGLGTAFGALVGSLLVGLFIQLSTLWLAEELKIASALFLMIVVLLVRPQGILGRRERVG